MLSLPPPRASPIAFVFALGLALGVAAGAAAAQPAPGAPTVVTAPPSAAPAPATPAPAPAPPTDAEAAAAREAAAPPHGDGQLSTGIPYGVPPPAHAPIARDGGEARPAGTIGLYDDEPEHDPRSGGDEAGSGMLGVVRIDGKGRGFAAGAGLLIARGPFDLEILALRSDVFGGYVGVRFRPYAGMFQPYIAAGLPGFVFDHDEQVDGTPQSTKRLAVGFRGAIGLELRLDRHVSLEGDLGFEHFFLADDRFEADVFVPTLGVIGRL